MGYQGRKVIIEHREIKDGGNWRKEKERVRGGKENERRKEATTNPEMQ